MYLKGYEIMDNIKIPKCVEVFLNSQNKKKVIRKIENCTEKRKVKYDNNSTWSKVQIVDFFKLYNVYSVKRLENLRNVYKIAAPRVADVKKYFPSFIDCVKYAFDGFVFPDEMNPKDFIKLCITHNISSKKHYLSVYRNEKNIFPTYKYIKKHFGCFRNLMTVLNYCNKSAMLEKYICLYMNLGKMPTKRDCNKYDIDYDFLMSIMTKSELYSLVDSLSFKLGK